MSSNRFQKQSRSSGSSGRRGGLLWLAAGLLVAAAVTGAGQQAHAGERVRLLNGGAGVTSQVRPKAADQPNHALRMTGQLRYSQRDGLSLDGTPVQLSHRTTLFPPPRGRFIDPSRLSGKRVTLFGRRQGDSVEAVLLILDSSPFGVRGSGLAGRNDRSPENFIRSNSDPRVGVLTRNAAR